MARYEHLPIYRAAFDLAVHMEKIVRHFSRYHKYSLGTELRERSRQILERIIEANNNNTVEREQILLQLRQDLEQFKVLARLCSESGGFASTRAYLQDKSWTPIFPSRPKLGIFMQVVVPKGSAASGFTVGKKSGRICPAHGA